MPFSYCDTTRAERASETIAMRTTTRTARKPSCWSIASLPHEERHAVHRLDGHERSLFEGSGARNRPGAPLLVTHPDLSRVVDVDAAQHHALQTNQGVGAARHVPHVDEIGRASGRERR